MGLTESLPKNGIEPSQKIGFGESLPKSAAKMLGEGFNHSTFTRCLLSGEGNRGETILKLYWERKDHYFSALPQENTIFNGYSERPCIV